MTAEGIPAWILEDSHPDWSPTAEAFFFPSLPMEDTWLWLRMRLPENRWQHPVFFFSSPTADCEVYLQGTLLTATGPLEADPAHRYSILQRYTVPLPPDFGGHYLYFRFFSERPKGVITSGIGLGNNRLTIGNYKDVLRATALHQADEFVIGVLLVMLSLYGVYLSFRKRQETPGLYLSFSAFAMSLGWFFICLSSVSHLIIQSLPFRYFVGYTAFLLFPFGLYAFYEQIIIQQYQRIFRRLWRFHLFFGVLALLLDLIDVLPLKAMQLVLFSILFFEIFLILVLGRKASKRGNLEAKIFNLGFSILGIFGLHDLLMAFGVIPHWHHFFGWGVFGFVVALSHILELNFTEKHYRLQVFSKELEITSQALKESHAQLEAYADTLETRVHERTQDLHEKNRALEEALQQLQDTQQQLVMQEKMASLGNLVAGIAHEINTPVGAVKSSADTSNRSIRMITELLESDTALAPLRENARFQKVLGILKSNNTVTVDASSRIATIVRSLRDFARLDQSEYQEVDLHDGLDSTLTLVQHALKNRVRVVKEYGALPPIRCYASQINQVFMNLLVNAAHAIEDTGTITITTRQIDTALQVRIADTGRGIPPEHLTKIFDPGFTTKGVGVGTGLGLSISYKILQAHQGDLTVESSVGHGTTFTMTLPL